MPARVLHDEQRERAMEMLVRGSSHRKVAEAFDVDHVTILNLVKEERGRLTARVERSVHEVLMELAMLREEAWQSYFDSEKTITDLDVTDTFGGRDSEGNKIPASELVQKVIRKARKASRKDPRWLVVIQGCLDHEIKLRGLQAPLTTRHELRWAGVAPEVIQNEMVRLLAQRIMELRQKGLPGVIEHDRIERTGTTDGTSGPESSLERPTDDGGGNPGPQSAGPDCGGNGPDDGGGPAGRG